MMTIIRICPLLLVNGHGCAFTTRKLLHCETMHCGKLAQRFYGPYKILERVGSIAYMLDIPEGSCLHDVFHVSLLKKFHGVASNVTPPLSLIQDGRAILEPAKVLSSSMLRVKHVLVQWVCSLEMDATLEPLADFIKQYPDYQLEDELVVEEGRDVMWGILYGGRKAAGTG